MHGPPLARGKLIWLSRPEIFGRVTEKFGGDSSRSASFAPGFADS
jgi:hypothetical protein